MSLTDERLAVFASPDRARSLFTVRAAISLARPVDAPRFFALALMCSYCRSRFGLEPAGMTSSRLRTALEDSPVRLAGNASLGSGGRVGCVGEQPGDVGGVRGERLRGLAGGVGLRAGVDLAV